MSDFPDEEPDPEMTEDHEENAPGLEEALEEIWRSKCKEPICSVDCQKYCCVCIQDLPFHEF